MNQKQRIVFVAGCLKPGMDGVGDYARKLAALCKEKNHEVFMISLYDRGLQEPVFETQNNISVLRIPDALNNLKQRKLAFSWIQEHQPTWISLQFVSYSFQPKGFCLKLIKIIDFFNKIAKLHIMAHELWIGPHDGAPLKECLIGILQRYWILKILRKADRLNTQCRAYQFLLAQNHLVAEILPLPSNIEVVINPQARLIVKEEINKKIKNFNYQGSFIFGFFGSLYRGFPHERIYKRLSEISQKTGKKILVLSLGHLGASIKDWKYFKSHCDDHIKAIRIEPGDDKKLSLFLQSLDFGLVTTPLSLLDKSGAAATFYAYGIPIIAIRDDVHFKGLIEEKNIIGAQSLDEDFYALKGKTSQRLDTISQTHSTELFLNSLK